MFKAKTVELDALAKKFPERIKELEKLLDDKTIVYIDFANVNGSVRKLGWKVDLKKLKELLFSFGIIEARFYFGHYPGDQRSRGFITLAHKVGYIIRTKPRKVMHISIDVTSISKGSPDILSSFISDKLLKELRVEVVEYLNEELRVLNKAGKISIEEQKCNFDVEIGTDMRVEKRAKSFCLWSGDSDFADTLNYLISEGMRISVFGTAKRIASELNELKSKGVTIYDLKKLREFIEFDPKAKRDSFRSLSAWKFGPNTQGETKALGVLI
jgi:uncharacterized LabA/DUF88 family protein